MSSVVRVSSGDTLQVRTGVVQGIGPQGPRGPAGIQGPQGDPGPQGDAGPTGAIEQITMEAISSGAQSIATATDTLVSLDTVLVDDFDAAVSITNFKPGIGNYYVSAYISFTKQSSVNASGYRKVALLVNGTDVASMSFPAVATSLTRITLASGVRLTDDEDVIQVQAYQTEGVTLTLTGRLWLTKVGPGARGATGPAGPEGPIGPAGPEGPAGPAGTVGNNTTTFAQLEAGSG